MYSIYLKHPFTMLIAGPSGCGKTFWLKQLINNVGRFINPVPKKISYFYAEYQKLFNTMMNVNFIKGLPEGLIEKIDGSEPHLIIIDDLMNESSSSKLISSLFTRGSHHKNLSVILIVQNLFIQGSESRNISLNAHYIVLFKNPRDKSISSMLARQMFPNKIVKFRNIFDHATSEPFSYLFIDLKPETPDEVRLLTNVLDENKIMYAYQL